MVTGGGGICVLVVGDLFQLPPVASSPVYMAPVMHGHLMTLHQMDGMSSGCMS